MKDRYYSFLLRIWESGAPEDPVWRVSIENTRTREMVGFDSLGGLFEYLKSVLSEKPVSGTSSLDTNSADHQD